ncbi:MAG: hypothetical protein WCP55_03850 [Lentisphaerota bacterium]
MEKNLVKAIGEFNEVRTTLLTSDPGGYSMEMLDSTAALIMMAAKIEKLNDSLGVLNTTAEMIRGKIPSISSYR